MLTRLFGRRLVLHGHPPEVDAARRPVLEEAAEVFGPHLRVLRLERAPHEAAVALHPTRRRPRARHQQQLRLERQRLTKQRDAVDVVGARVEAAQLDVVGRAVVVRVRARREVGARDRHAAEAVADAMRPEELAQELLLQWRRRARERVGRRVGERRAEAEDLLALVLRPHGGGEIALREAKKLPNGTSRRCRNGPLLFAPVASDGADTNTTAVSSRSAPTRGGASQRPSVQRVYSGGAGAASSASERCELATTSTMAKSSARRRHSWRPQRAASSVAPTPACRARRTASRTRA